MQEIIIQTKWTIVNITKDQSLSKEVNAVYIAGLERDALLWAHFKEKNYWFEQYYS